MKPTKLLLPLLFFVAFNTFSYAQYVFNTKTELQDAVDMWCAPEPRPYTREDVVAIYGEPNTWNVSAITDMSYLFFYKRFNEPISNWDVSNVINMSHMFENGTPTHSQPYMSNFNQDIGSWDVSNVTDMSGMFLNAVFFNQDISSWNVSNVTDMSSMFQSANSFNQDIDRWDVSNVTTMRYMFGNPVFDELSISRHGFNQNINSWNVSNVTDMEGMFINSVFNGNISGWDVSNVTDMSRMFSVAISFNQDIGSWGVSSVIDMKNMFSGAGSFNQNIGGWNVSNVTDMSHMFSGGTASSFAVSTTFNQNIGAWNVSNVTDMTRMFSYNIGFSSENYDKLLQGWSVLGLQNDVRLDVSTPYCEAISRQKIIDDFGWTINDEGLSGTCILSSNDFAFESFEFYPNPTSNILNIKLNSNINYTINSVLGKTIMSGFLKSGENEVNVSHLQNGLYVISLYSDSATKTLKFVKE